MFSLSFGFNVKFKTAVIRQIMSPFWSYVYSSETLQSTHTVIFKTQNIHVSTDNTVQHTKCL